MNKKAHKGKKKCVIQERKPIFPFTRQETLAASSEKQETIIMVGGGDDKLKPREIDDGG